jgi:hypothetical protein
MFVKKCFVVMKVQFLLFRMFHCTLFLQKQCTAGILHFLFTQGSVIVEGKLMRDRLQGSVKCCIVPQPKMI